MNYQDAEAVSPTPEDQSAGESKNPEAWEDAPTFLEMVAALQRAWLESGGKPPSPLDEW